VLGICRGNFTCKWFCSCHYRINLGGNSMTYAIKPCPFCGAEPRMNECICCGYTGIVCPECGASMHITVLPTSEDVTAERDEAVKRWNTRMKMEVMNRRRGHADRTFHRRDQLHCESEDRDVLSEKKLSRHWKNRSRASSTIRSLTSPEMRRIRQPELRFD